VTTPTIGEASLAEVLTGTNIESSVEELATLSDAEASETHDSAAERVTRYRSR
jgi:hypothetical protein